MAVNWTILGIASLTIVAVYLAWFVVLLLRRARAPQTRSLPVWARIRDLVVDGLALVILLAVSGLPALPLMPLIITIALALWTFAPRYVTSKILPFCLVLTAANGAELMRIAARDDWTMSWYGVISVHDTTLFERLVPIQALVFLALGLWLGWRRTDPQSLIGRAVLRQAGRVPGGQVGPRWGLLLLPMVSLLIELLGRTYWLGLRWWGASLTTAVVIAAIALVIWLPAVAADVAIVGMILYSLYGLALALWWPTHVPLPSPYTEQVRYGLVVVDDRGWAVLAGVQALAILGAAIWLIPRAIDDRSRNLLRTATDAELATRVMRLTRTRADAVDTATAQLRRLERDLHDGAQARLVALGMSLRAAERLIPESPAAAVALVAEARETSVKVLDELRTLVRGICPPVLADRGLADAVRALALDTPLRTEVQVDLPGRPDLPIETACYFAVAEALANAVKHSGARSIQIRIGYDSALLRISVIDDGTGGADPAHGTGLAGLERRLGTFDGVLAVSSPPGGPTIVAIEVPCALSSQKISTC